MSVVLCDLFRSHYDSEHSEKVSECLLCTGEEPWHKVSCSNLDITDRTEEHADEERPINKEHTADTLRRISLLFKTALLTYYLLIKVIRLQMGMNYKCQDRLYLVLFCLIS